VFLSGPASILKACAKGGPARPGSEAAKKKPAGRPPRKAGRPPRKSLQIGRPAAKKKPTGRPPGRQEKARRPGQKSLQARCGGKIRFSPPPPLSLADD